MRKKGSAILTIISAIVILIILALGFINSKSQKTVISKHLSDEKKVEAIAETVSELIMSFLKKNKLNDHENIDDVKDFYYLLRLPLKVKTSSSDEILDVSTAKIIDDLSVYIPYEQILQKTIQEVGWKFDDVKIKTKCELVGAERFTAANSEYKVTTIDCEHLPARGNSAKFLDAKIPPSSSASDGQSYKPSKWELKIKFPNGGATVERKQFEIEFGISFIEDLKKKWNDFKNDFKNLLGFGEEEIDEEAQKSNVTLIINRAEDFVTRFSPIEVETQTLGTIKVMDELDIQKEMDKFNCVFFDDINPKNMQGLTNYILGTGDYKDYNLGDYLGEIVKGYNNIKGVFADIDTDNYDMFVEKGGILRFTVEVDYSKSDTKSINKVLVTEIPFKVSDTQPIASEYSLFIANSGKLLSSPSDISSPNLGKPIDLNSNDDGTGGVAGVQYSVGKMVIHNLPWETNADKPSFEFNSRIPGMVRINSQYSGKGSKTNEVRSFLGVLNEAYTSELNKFFTPFDSNNIGDYNVNKFNTVVSFIWDDTSPIKRYHEIEFPVLFEDDNRPAVGNVITPPGLKGVVQYFKEGNVDLVSVPTLLFGYGGMEYPLGICAEGPIKSKFSRCRIQAKPSAKVNIKGFDLDVDEKTEITYSYRNVTTYGKENTPFDFGNDTGLDDTNAEPAQYGMQGYECYNPDAKWDSDTEYKYMPSNCYDAMQYAKKATRFYESEGDFIADCNKGVSEGGLKDGDTVKLSGVYYIKGELSLNNMSFSGNGLIVAKNIRLSGKVGCRNDDETSSLGLIARIGRLEFDEAEVHAACFSNDSPETAGKNKIYGNLVCNSFERDKFQEVEIFYDNRITSTSPLSTMRKVGKFEPRRYYVSFADNWSKFAYEKFKDEE